jgi:hypothetical protein
VFTVWGNVGLEQCANLAQPVNFEIRTSAGVNYDQTVTLGSDGSYELDNVPVTTQSIAVKGQSWLQSVVPLTVAGNMSGVNVPLLAGDINGDNVVDLDDFSLLAQAFGSNSISANWNAAADLNCDGVVDLLDFTILAQNFGLTGDP